MRDTVSIEAKQIENNKHFVLRLVENELNSELKQIVVRQYKPALELKLDLFRKSVLLKRTQKLDSSEIIYGSSY